MTSRRTPIRIGVDTGGTFTDLLCLDERGLHVHKLRSVPSDPSKAILDGIRLLLANTGAGDLSSVHLEVTHGSTVATNAVLERKGARVALITTAGFEDVLRIGRQTRPDLYDFDVTRPEPLVARDLTFGVHERITAAGAVLQAPQRSEIETLIGKLKKKSVESVAVCFLHSYLDTTHEESVANALRSAGFLVSASHEVLPEYREYERFATTVVNAYVAPLMGRYLTRLQESLGTAELRIMQSNGGSISAARASVEAVQTILSGPAAGVVGAQAVGAASGFTQLITFDMGGTSTDVSLIDAAIGTTNESLVGDLPVRLPVLDVHTVGAGGGSIAWIDLGGSLRVGPRSAGADPGPVCFGTGENLTVTDANLLLGRLDPAYFLGGRMALDLDRTKAIARQFATKLGMSPGKLAEGIVRIANANMERAVRVVSVQRGFDPRDFALLAFGGAGGLHACELAASLDMETVVIPEHSGVLSALGMLLADVAKDYSASVLMDAAQLSPQELRARVDALATRAEHDLHAEGFGDEQITITVTVAMRYKGQSFEIDVPVDPASAENAAPQMQVRAIAGLIEAFHRSHERLYGYSNTERATEVVQLRLRAVGRTSKPVLTRAQEMQLGADGARELPAPESARAAVFAGRAVRTPVFHRAALMPGMGGEGPVIVAGGESTIVVPPGWRWHIDSSGSLVAKRSSTRSGVAHAR